jgi:hypothetical protein
MGCVGVLVTRATNTTINNNSISFVDGIECQPETKTCIAAYELYRTWLADSSEVSTDNITKITNYSSSGIYVSNNTCINANILLALYGSKNVTHDFTSFWFKSYQFPTYLVDRADLYCSNSVNQFNISQGYMGAFTRDYAKITLDKTFEYYKNTNLTQNYGLNLFNLTSALLSFGNGTIMYPVSGDVNISLAPNEDVYIYDSYCLDSSHYWDGSSCKQKTYQNVCDSGDIIFKGVVLMLPLLVILILLLVLGFKNGQFETKNAGDKLLQFGGTLLLFFIIIVIGIVMVAQIGGCG